MKLYLDLCVYNRPFDFQGQERIALETSAFIYLLEKIEKGNHTLIISEALIYENNKNPHEQRKIRIASYFRMAQELIEIDALHIALAEKARVDYFITCDDTVTNLYKKHRNFIKVVITNLMEFVGLEVK